MYRVARRRVLFLRWLFAGCTLLLFARLAQLQLLEHSYWAYEGFRNREKVLPRPVRRGSLLDRQGRPLAWDEGAHDVELVYRDFRRGNPLGQAFHLALLGHADPILDPEEWERLRSHRALLEEREDLREAGDAAGGRLAEVEGRLAAERRREAPDPRPLSLLWAKDHLEELSGWIHAFGSRDLAGEEGAATLAAASGTGPSREDLKARARVVRVSQRWYLLRLLGGALEVAAATRDPALAASLAEARRAGGVEAWLRRRWRREIDDPGRPVASFAAALGVSREDLQALLRQGLEALRIPGAGARDPLERLDQIHRRDVRLLAWLGGNEWPLWDRGFRDRMRQVEDSRSPLWRNVPYDVVREIGLRPRAHAGFLVVDSVRRILVDAGGWTPAARLLGRVTGAMAEDRIEVDLAWLEAPLPGLETFWAEYRRSVAGRAQRQKESIQRFGREGLEEVLDGELRGEEGWRLAETDRLARQRFSRHERVERPGRDVQIALDLDLQVALEKALAAASLPGGAEPVQAGGAVVHCRTGEVLALAATPLVSTEELARAAGRLAELRRGDVEAEPGEKRSLTRLLADSSRLPLFSGVPGSTFKVVTALAALRHGLAGDLECGGSLPLPWGGRIQCEGVHGLLGLTRALEVSCNVYFARLGAALPAGALAAEAERLGFGGGWRAGWSGPVLPTHPPKLEEGAAPQQAIGYHVQATPLAMARVYAAVAVGQLRPLRLLAGGGGEPGLALGIPAEGLARIREGLWRVVAGREGTARRFGLERLEVCGKTGTAQLTDGREGPNNAWFVGFTPRRAPLLAFAVLFPGVPHGVHGGEMAAPAAGRFLADPAVQGWIAREAGR